MPYAIFDEEIINILDIDYHEINVDVSCES